GASTFNGTTGISGGLLTGAGAITMTNTLNWSAGTIDATVASTLTTPLGATSTVTGGTLGANRTWNNSGTLNITVPAWTKTGMLNHNAGGLNLNGNFSAANMVAFNRAAGSTVNLNGAFDNTGNTLDIGGAGIFGTGGLSGLNSGTIIGGTLVSNDGTVLNSNSGTLDGVIIGSNLTESGFLQIANNLTLAPNVTLNKGSSQWNFVTTSPHHTPIHA